MVEEPIELKFAVNGRILQSVSKALLLRGKHYCPKCKRVLPVKNFHTRNSNGGSRSGEPFGFCKECYKPTNKANGKEAWDKKGRALYWKLIKACISWLGAECARCGYSEYQSALEFHHVHPEEKKFAISTYATRWHYTKGEVDKTLEEELDKCALLCSCCHRAFEASEWSGEWVKRDAGGWTLKSTIDISVF